MAVFESFEDIDAWKRARKLAQEISVICLRNGIRNDFTLRNQINGSIGSVMDNIAEGFERGGNREFIQFLYVSKGSAGEFRSQLFRMLDRTYISELEFLRIRNEIIQISKMISGLIQYLKRTPLRGDKYT